MLDNDLLTCLKSLVLSFYPFYPSVLESPPLYDMVYYLMIEGRKHISRLQSNDVSSTPCQSCTHFHLIQLNQEHLHAETQLMSGRNQYPVVLQGLLEVYLSAKGEGGSLETPCPLVPLVLLVFVFLQSDSCLYEAVNLCPEPTFS